MRKFLININGSDMYLALHIYYIEECIEKERTIERSEVR
jgi:hypothetical protein